VKATKHPFHEVDAGTIAAGLLGGLDNHEAAVGEVGDQDSCDAERNSPMRGDFRDRLRRAAQEADCGFFPGAGVLRDAASLGCGDERFDGERTRGPRTSMGAEVRPDKICRVRVEPQRRLHIGSSLKSIDCRKSFAGQPIVGNRPNG
jgi:hypothetical protein